MEIWPISYRAGRHFFHLIRIPGIFDTLLLLRACYVGFLLHAGAARDFTAIHIAIHFVPSVLQSRSVDIPWILDSCVLPNGSNIPYCTSALTATA